MRKSIVHFPFIESLKYTAWAAVYTILKYLKISSILSVSRAYYLLICYPSNRYLGVVATSGLLEPRGC